LITGVKGEEEKATKKGTCMILSMQLTVFYVKYYFKLLLYLQLPFLVGYQACNVGIILHHTTKVRTVMCRENFDPGSILLKKSYMGDFNSK
jgi:hypothetical protein